MRWCRVVLAAGFCVGCYGRLCGVGCTRCSLVLQSRAELRGVRTCEGLSSDVFFGALCFVGVLRSEVLFFGTEDHGMA